MEKKEISARTTVKAIITGFVSYGIITIFVSILMTTVIMKEKTASQILRDTAY